ncbi:hypothetical protein [Companilactobacillus sp. DQM5]|uniref:hypothetical protein n=1 Tax=Companilactobacillus sp. DQM5 TaxID=3463359 RepID=UPI0040585573
MNMDLEQMKSFMEESSKDFDVFRNDSKVDTIKAFFTGNHGLQVTPSYEVMEGDILVDELNKKYFVNEVNPIPYPGEPNAGFEVKYDTEFSKQNNPKSPITIGTVNGIASIGDNNNNVFNNSVNDLKDIKNLLDSYSDVSDKQKEELISLLDITKDSNIPMSAGFLSKFKSLFEKHSELGISVGVFIVKLLSNLL